MLFAKKMEPRCAYCRKGAAMDGDKILCIRRGIVSPGWHCRFFRYDPLKRIPSRPPAPDFSGFRDEDFVL